MPSSSPPSPTIQKCLLRPHAKVCRAVLQRPVSGRQAGSIPDRWDLFVETRGKIPDLMIETDCLCFDFAMRLKSGTPS